MKINKTRWISAFLILFLTLSFIPGVFPAQKASAASNTGKFYNSINNMGNDPWVVYKDGYYYLIESVGGGLWVTKSPSNSLTRIATEGTRVNIKAFPTGSGANCTGVWAPELHFLNNKWYVYYAATTCDDNNNNHRMFVLESNSSDPQGSYTDKGKIAATTDRWAIDGHVFTYNSQMYMVWSGWAGTTSGGAQNTYIATMSNPWTISGDRVLIASPTYSWEKIGGPDYINEGPTVLIRNGKVNIVYSASGSWTDDYCLGLLTNSTGNLMNPANWVKKSTPVFSKTSDVFGPGHASFTKSPDGTEDWIVYHSARKSGSAWDRIMNLQKFTWNTDDTPNFGTPISPTVRQTAPSGEPAWNDYGWGDSSSGTLEIGNWTHLSTNSIRSYNLGSGFKQVFRGDVNQTSYTLSADVKWLKTGTVSPNPKYGIYANYKDSSNYVMAMIDKNLGVLATYAIVGGVAQAWQNTALPPGTNLNNANNIKVVKDGNNFYFHVNNNLLQVRSLAISNGQIGMVTEDTQAEYTNFAVTANATRYYKILNKKSGRALSVEAGGTTNGSRSIIWDFISADDQYWQVLSNGNGTVRFLNKKSGRALSILLGGTSNGSTVHIWDYLSATDQHWSISQGSTGYLKVLNAASNRALSLVSGGTANNTYAHLWDYLGGVDDQDWSIILT
ncbi:family 43 glycosylhydrolase [Paenibacillus psychroresistens]|uniref:family 43 glycosylhydrolase n=1 Tax=Paenibacillus psychroresistens TaxID=1778678 RepID=UPI0013916D42|nr:family 43 glycosylhydrolase [Paenibacillus psychroresistens]